MKYDDLYNDFVSLFPDDISFFKAAEEATGAAIAVDKWFKPE
jgi:hypothetical protein